MALGPGTRLGPYEIQSAIGAGGMGEVYRATDTALGRNVAIKVLPEAFAHDAERLARFEREAKTLAALNHPHIAQIYGLEKSGGTPALVLELVDGETLSDRLGRGPMPLDEALPMARQIAEAVEAAHDHGIVHRDLKPANIKVTPDGQVKVLDFGLAKLAETADGRQAAGNAATMSPTITSPAMITGVGVLLGTAAYMSPEQAKGKPADKRSDIWAFGCVLFEMLAAKRPFEPSASLPDATSSGQGQDVTDTLAAILMREPDWAALPASISPAIRVLLRHCLEKNRHRRIPDVSAIRFVLAEHAAMSVGTTDSDPAHVRKDRTDERSAAALLEERPALARSQRRGVAIASSAVIVATATMIVGAVVWSGVWTSSQPPAVVRFQITTPGASAAEMFTLSPDGRHLAFIANTGGTDQIWVRAMDTLEARAIAGTDGATYPFWSPDGGYLGFFAQSKLKTIAVGGGPAQTLCDATSGRGGTWNRDGVILFSASPTSPILRVSAAGGVPVPVTQIVAGDAGTGHRYPVFLPDSRRFLFTTITGSDQADGRGVYVGSLDGATPVRLLAYASNALYVSPDGPGTRGHLVFRREDTLMAQPFDHENLTLVGDVFPITGEVPTAGAAGFGAFAASNTGTIVYRTGRSVPNRELGWVDRTGNRLGTVMEPGAIAGAPAISPDGRTAAFRINDDSGADIWLRDMNRGVSSRLTFGPTSDESPVWSPDGERIAFSSQPAPGTLADLNQKPASGNGREELVVKAGVNASVSDWSSDGKWLVYRQADGTTRSDLWLLPLGGDRKPVSYLQTRFVEDNARFAPGLGGPPRWMAYQSDESGEEQIYIQGIPAGGAKYQVSTAGGTLSAWRRDGKELYYLSADQKLMAVPVTLGASVEFGTPKELFASPGVAGYAPSADGQRFLLNLPTAGEAASAPPITVVLNWTAGLPK